MTLQPGDKVRIIKPKPDDPIADFFNMIIDYIIDRYHYLTAIFDKPLAEVTGYEALMMLVVISLFLSFTRLMNKL